MKWRKPNIIWLAGIPGTLLLIALFQGFAIEGFSFEEKINIVDVAAAFLTLFLAFYVPHRIEKAISTQRYELESLINEVRQILSYFDLALSTIQASENPASQEDQSIILRAVVNSGQALQVLETLFQENEMAHLQERIDAIRVQRLTFKRLTTGGRFQSSGFYYDPYVLSLITTAYHSLKIECLRLIFKINRS